tara:strand:+ start:550 stop:1026 length:477 start_codon:yes stop_codon:yes gene_type:complete
MITKENYITASFIDNDRKNIEVLLRDDKNEKVIPFIVEYNPEHPNCQDLLKLVDLDTLHENTYQKIQTEKKNFEEMAINIAKKNGLVFNETKLNTKFYPTLIKAMFNELENEDHLFALKLALFEVDKIRDSKDNEKKKKLRQSKNKIDVLKLAIDLIG